MIGRRIKMFNRFDWWHLFPTNGDDRAKLTWLNRFPKVLNVGINFYSSGDEVSERVVPGNLPKASQ